MVSGIPRSGLKNSSIDDWPSGIWDKIGSSLWDYFGINVYSTSLVIFLLKI